VGFADVRFEEPFYFGLIDKWTFLMVFESTRNVRFLHSPSGGGWADARHMRTNPACDFQCVIHNCATVEMHKFRYSLVVDEFSGFEAAAQQARDSRKRLHDTKVRGS